MVACVFMAAFFAALTAPQEAVAQENPSGKRWAVFVGVDDYQMTQELKFSVNDAKKLKERFLDLRFEEERTFCLTSGAETKLLPTKFNIMQKISQVSDLADPGDMVLISLHGHGIEIDGKAYFCPMDVSRNYLKESTLEIDWIYKTLESSKATYKLVMIDACREPTQASVRAFGVKSKPLSMPEKEVPPSVSLFQSCSGAEFSHEDVEYMHGVFTYYILEGLSGKADANGDGIITMKELVDYVKDATKLRVMNKFDAVQRPVFTGTLDQYVAVKLNDIDKTIRKGFDKLNEVMREETDKLRGDKTIQEKNHAENPAMFRYVNEEVFFDSDVRIQSICATPEGKFLVAYNEWFNQDRIRYYTKTLIWDAKAKKNISSFETVDSSLRGGNYSFSPKGSYYQWEYRDADIDMLTIWECSSGRLIKQFKPTDSTSFQKEWSHDEKYVMTVHTEQGNDKTLKVYIYNFADNQERTFDFDRGETFNVAKTSVYGFAPQDQFVVSEKVKERVFILKFIDIASGKVRSEMVVDNAYWRPTFFDYSPDAKYLPRITGSNTIQLWSLQDKQLLFEASVPVQRLGDNCFWDPNSKYVAFCSRYADPEVAVVDVNSGESHVFKAGGETSQDGYTFATPRISFSPDGNFFAVRVVAEGNGMKVGTSIFGVNSGFIASLGDGDHRVCAWLGDNSIITVKYDEDRSNDYHKLYRWTFSDKPFK